MKPVLNLISTSKEFHDLEKDWNHLYESCENSTIFSSWDWMYTWWEVFGSQFKRKLFILCIRQNNQLIGVAPFQIVKNYPKSFIQGRTLCFIGLGEGAKDSIVSQFVDLIIKPGMEADVTNLVSEYLIQSRKQWDFADFEYLLKDALILKCFDSEKSKLTKQLTEYGKRFYVSDIDNYEASLSKRWRKMLSKKNRILGKDGNVKITSSGIDEDSETSLARLAEMHEARWKDRTGQNIFKSTKFYDFHKRILKRLSPQKRAFIKTLYKGDEPLACYYYFTDKNQVHYYQSGFYTKYANRYSPLFLLVCKEIIRVLEENKLFDFMFTDKKSSYKQDQYAADHEKMYRLKLAQGNIRFLIFDCAKCLQTKILMIRRKYIR